MFQIFCRDGYARKNRLENLHIHSLFDACAVIQYDTVAEYRGDHCLHVVRRDKIASGKDGVYLYGL